jgi:2,3-bisphosphoglycerate-independent phosphoglycerate mutase
MPLIPGVPRRPVVLIILDGFGVNPSKRHNGVAEAHTPRLDDYFSRFAHTTLSASGAAVGLPDGQMGNSEVGHLTLGAGSITRQDSVRIDDAIASEEFFSNPVFVNAATRARGLGRPLHLLGLVSDGGVHSQLGHLLALVELCRRQGARPQLHMITDGRDTLPQSALNYLPQIEARLHEAGGRIGSVMGRYYAMDRDHRWERTERAWRALVLDKGNRGTSASSAIRGAYAAGDSDEFIQPILLPGFAAIAHGDPLVSFNFRKDRPRQLIAALGAREFDGFDRGQSARPDISCMMPYDRSQPFACAFQPEAPATTLGEHISALGLRQLHCAETEKYAHVTYFFNGGRDSPYPGEDQLLIPSPRVATYDLKPSMSARQVADQVIARLRSKQYAFIVVNFANGDMVGHTARRDAVLEAVETLDHEAGRVLDTAWDIGYTALLTADHGNCEELIDPFTGEPHTQHTTYPVPCLVMDECNWRLSSNGGLANIAPTVLQLMGLPHAQGMSSDSLLLKQMPGQRGNGRDQCQATVLRGAA